MPNRTNAPPQAKPSQGGQKLYDNLLAGLLEFVWGKGKPDIQRQLQQANADTLATVIGHITFALVQQGAEQAEQRGLQPDVNLLLGVATETIESLEKMAAAMNLQFDPKAVSLQALVQTLTDYSQSLPPDSPSQQEAKEALAELGQGTIQQGMQTAQDIGSAHGIDPFGGQGQPTAGPAPDAGGAQQQGLMGAANG